MRKLFVLGIIMALTTTAFAGNREVGSVGGRIQQCERQAEVALKKKISTFANTYFIGFVDSIQLQPGDEAFFDKDEVWNSEKVPVIIHLFKLNTGGISYNVQVKLSVPECKVLSMENGSLY